MRAIFSLGALLLFAGGARAEAPRDFCPDRPGLGTPACTIDQGHVAVELGLVDWTLDRQPGAREDDVAAGDLLVRYGLTDSLEMQIGWTAYTHVRARSGTVVDRAGGTGDLFVALRRNLRNPDGSGFAVAVMPYATLPVGSEGIGAGDWGAGVLVPMSYELPHGFALGLTAEADAAVDEDGHGRHLAYSAILGLDLPISDAVGATVELSAGRDEDPSGHATQLLAGLSAGWTPNRDLQLDVGANLGLNRDAPDVELYFGVARRF
ncbi:MAG TPA: transporter [Allosphingosinicella sp.]|nr:transporter [Allosphingosinicella sp.]